MDLTGAHEWLDYVVHHLPTVTGKLDAHSAAFQLGHWRQKRATFFTLGGQCHHVMPLYLSLGASFRNLRKHWCVRLERISRHSRAKRPLSAPKVWGSCVEAAWLGTELRPMFRLLIPSKLQSTLCLSKHLNRVSHVLQRISPGNLLVLLELVCVGVKQLLTCILIELHVKYRSLFKHIGHLVGKQELVGWPCIVCSFWVHCLQDRVCIVVRNGVLPMIEANGTEGKVGTLQVALLQVGPLLLEGGGHNRRLVVEGSWHIGSSELACRQLRKLNMFFKFLSYTFMIVKVNSCRKRVTLSPHEGVSLPVRSSFFNRFFKYLFWLYNFIIPLCNWNRLSLRFWAFIAVGKDSILLLALLWKVVCHL